MRSESAPAHTTPQLDHTNSKAFTLASVAHACMGAALTNVTSLALLLRLLLEGGWHWGHVRPCWQSRTAQRGTVQREGESSVCAWLLVGLLR